MTATPWFSFDADPLLPAGWQVDCTELAAGPELIELIAGDDWRFAVVTGNVVTRRLDWLWRLYHGPFCAFASQAFGRRLFPANRRDSTLTLNVLSGPGATNDWHRDANPVTGVLFATTLEPAAGGALAFRSAAGQGDGDDRALQPRAGTFVCFPGPHEHRVLPLVGSARRLAIAMTFYHSAADQPYASEVDRYDLPA